MEKKYKLSNIDWIGNIPSNWEIVKVKDVFFYHKEIVKEKAYQYNRVALTMNGVILRDKNDTNGLQPEDFDGYQIVNENDLIFKLIDLENVSTSRVGRSDYEGMTSPAYILLHEKEKKSKYYEYYFLNLYYQEIFNNIGGNGVRSAINKNDLLNIPLVVPPYLEQCRISKFLDEKINKINKILKNHNENIKLLVKLKKSLCTEYVLGEKENVDKHVTNIPYIGKIPNNWKEYKIKNICSLKSEKNHPNSEVLSLYREYGVVRKADRDDNHNVTSEKIEDYKFVEINDVVVNKMKAWQGSIAVSNYEGIISPAYHVYKVNTEIVEPKFLHYLLRNEKYIPEYMRLSTGIRLGQWDLSTNNFKNISIFLPDKNTQKKIVKRLDYLTQKIDKAINYRAQIVKKIEEYKKSLIYEYVTGKKKISGTTIIKTNQKQVKINCKDNIFAQAILLCRVIEKLNNYNLGRVKAEKTLYLIEKDIGFDFDNNYVREAAGPLSESIYKCESVVSKKNKWIKVNKVKKHIEYEILSDFSKYSKYYNKYYSDYDNQIESIIEKVKNYSTDKSEMVATLYASWNDFLIKNEEISDLKIVKDVRENWNDTKKRFNEQKWLDVLEEMKNIELTPKGNGNLTIIKEN